MDQKNLRFFAETIAPQLIEWRLSANDHPNIREIAFISDLALEAISHADQMDKQELTAEVPDEPKPKPKPKSKSKSKPKGSPLKGRKQRPEVLRRNIRKTLDDCPFPEGRLIRERRADLGISQATLAEKSGIHPIQITQIELGKTPVTDANAVRLVRALGGAPEDYRTPEDQMEIRRLNGKGLLEFDDDGNPVVPDEFLA